jgi:hypothetical protein
MTPSSLQNIAGLREVALPPEFPPGIYFLCFKGELQYVGQSIRVLIRILEHREQKQKLFDSVYFVPCPVSDLDCQEGHYIVTLKPPLNGSLHSKIEKYPIKKYPRPRKNPRRQKITMWDALLELGHGEAA